MESDRELSTRIRAGDSAAVEAFYQRFMPTLWRFIRARLPGDPSAAQDVLSETFLAALRNVRRYDSSKGSAAGWLTGIARHKLADLRRHAPVVSLQDHDLASPVGTPSDPMRQRELEVQIRQAMLLLNDEERLVLEWKYIEGLAVSEIASRLGRSEKAVEALLYRARQAFRRRFQPDAEPERKSP